MYNFRCLRFSTPSSFQREIDDRDDDDDDVCCRSRLKIIFFCSELAFFFCYFVSAIADFFRKFMKSSSEPRFANLEMGNLRFFATIRYSLLTFYNELTRARLKLTKSVEISPVSTTLHAKKRLEKILY
uniref:(northern house mosquito) hypothetical protein n=1 Tax=Culex pipiens TaxID=7175 RepID=A0A8D8KMP9_CULPI